MDVHAAVEGLQILIRGLDDFDPNNVVASAGRLLAGPFAVDTSVLDLLDTHYGLFPPHSDTDLDEASYVPPDGWEEHGYPAPPIASILYFGCMAENLIYAAKTVLRSVPPEDVRWCYEPLAVHRETASRTVDELLLVGDPCLLNEMGGIAVRSIARMKAGSDDLRVGLSRLMTVRDMMDASPVVKGGLLTAILEPTDPQADGKLPPLPPTQPSDGWIDMNFTGKRQARRNRFLRLLLPGHVLSYEQIRGQVFRTDDARITDNPSIDRFVVRLNNKLIRPACIQSAEGRYRIDPVADIGYRLVKV